jgi:K+-transporting ATPase KdpF subunit
MRSGERAMDTENLIGLILAVGLFVFLIAALLFPERF